MADLQKENGKGKEAVETVPVLDEKRQHILEELSELMNHAGGDYSPLLMEKLQKRLEFVVQNFNEELKILMQRSFENWKIKDSQIRDIMVCNIGNLQATKSQPEKEKPDDSSTPDFIKNVAFGPLRSK